MLDKRFMNRGDKIRILIISSLFCLPVWLLAQNQAKGYETREHQIELSFDTEIKYQYVITLPADYESDSDRLWPMILYLHGGGTPKIDQLIERNSSFSDLPAIVVLPLCPLSPDGAIYSNWHWKMLGALVREVCEWYRIDPEMRSVIGHSMGGSAAWELPFHEQDLFAKSVVLAGVCHPWSLRHYPNIPVWAFVGADDYMRKEQQETISSAKRFGVDVVETVWPGANHGSILRNAKSYQRMLDWLVTKDDLRRESAPPE